MGKVAEIVPLIRGAAKKLDRLERSELISVYEQYRTASNEWLRRQIVEHNRIDILAVVILGYTVKPFHLEMFKWQFRHPQNLVLSFRGGGKSTICTVVKAIHLHCKNRALRILIGSESKGTASDILRDIKGHYESNDRLSEVFGVFYNPKIVQKWDASEISIVGAPMARKESSIMCAGPDTRITGKHFDVGLIDDLVTEDNSRTEHIRMRVKTWYYKTYRPLILPPKEGFEHRGEQHHNGTFYHWDDHYHHLEENELKGRVLKIDALDEKENSPWPEEYPPEFFFNQRDDLGIINFNSQYMNDTESMKGEIFQYDDCQMIEEVDYPPLSDMLVTMGVDLSADEKEQKKNAMFAIAVIGITGNIAKDDIYIYLLDFYLQHLRPSKQSAKVLDYFDLHNPIRVGIETNQYQVSLKEDVKLKRPQMNAIKIHTQIDKITRGINLSKYFENGRVFFKKRVHAKPVSHLVLFSANSKYKDFFDAFDNAVYAAKKRRKKDKPPRKPFGVL